MNNLSAEALLARFFPVEMLRTYCEERLRVSEKGNEATLAARIARAWGKPDFVPYPINNNHDEKKQSDIQTTNEEDDTGKKRCGKANDDDNNNETNNESLSTNTKKRKLWTCNEKRPPFKVTAPPGPLGLTIQQYSDDFIITNISSSCSIQPQHKVRVGDVLRAIDGYELLSEEDVPPTTNSDQSRELTFSTRVISRNAADHPKGSLLYMKEMKMPMFRIMNYTGVEEKYGEEFLEELDPPNRGRSGKSILVGALSSLGQGSK